MEVLVLKLIMGEILLILLLLLDELNVPRYIYEELYTNPKTKGIVKIIGDTFYMVGGSIMASVVYALLTTSVGFNAATFTAGPALTALGAYLKR